MSYMAWTRRDTCSHTYREREGEREREGLGERGRERGEREREKPADRETERTQPCTWICPSNASHALREHILYSKRTHSI